MPAMRLNSSPLRCGLGVFDEFANRMGGRRIGHHHDVGNNREQTDRREVVERIVAGGRIERRVDRQIRRAEQERVAVRRRVGRLVGADIAAGAAAVLDDDLLAPDLGQALRQRTRQRVTAAARWKRHDQTHEAVRIALRTRRPRQQRQG
jgi:hypothetical protein